MTSKFRKVVYAGVSIFAVFALLMTSTLPMYANDTVEEEVIEKVETEEVETPEVEEETIVEEIEATEEVVAEIEDESVEPIAEVLADEEPEVSLRAADMSNVINVAELKEVVAAAQSGDTITLATDYVSGTETISIADKTLTINGNGSVSKGGTLTVEGTGTLTIKDMKFDGEGFDQSLLVNKIAGSLVIENSEFYNSSKVAFNAASSGKTEINRTEFYNNTSGGQGVAISLSSHADVTINHSTIKDNIGTGGGYESGAIGGKFFSGKLRINNTTFENNVNKGACTGQIGGGGGAIFINGFHGEIWINESIFRGNSTNGADGARSATFDGGAIYLFNMRKGAIFNVDKSAFIDNIAYDDGGAILIQTEGNNTGEIVDGTSITNSTFFGNKAYGVDNSAYSGGAIQIYANVGFTGRLNTAATIVGNTFVNNTAGGISDTDDYVSGSAIGLSMASFRSTMKVTLENNIFAGNLAIEPDGTVEDSVDDTISVASYIANRTTYKTDNIGLTDGQKSLDVLKEVFGDFPTIKLHTSFTSGVAGAVDERIPFLAFIPNSPVDNTHETVVSGQDQRSYSRYKDYGAVENSWIKYDANGGEYELPELTEFDALSYYKAEESGPNAGKIVEFYSISGIDDIPVAFDEETSKIKHPDATKVFLGWGLTPDATEPNVELPVYFGEENKTYYAVWGDVETYTVTYNANGGEGDVPVDPQEYLVDASAVVLENSLTMKNHIFKGWSLSVDGTGTLYQTGDEVLIQGDTILFAVWEKVKAPVKPTDPVKPVEPSPVLPSTGVDSSTHWLAFLVAGFAILILKNYKREQH